MLAHPTPCKGTQPDEDQPCRFGLGHCSDGRRRQPRIDGMEVRISDAPRSNEIMVAVAVTDSGRPIPRVGGLTKDQIKGEDGLR